METKNAQGAIENGAQCTIQNYYGPVKLQSGDTVSVRRSNDDLDINCQLLSGTTAKGRAISRANAGLAGNIIFGGGIGAIIDHNRGTAYTYPHWVQLEIGKTLVFDRSDETDGKPVVGTELTDSSK